MDLLLDIHWNRSLLTLVFSIRSFVSFLLTPPLKEGCYGNFFTENVEGLGLRDPKFNCCQKDMVWGTNAIFIPSVGDSLKPISAFKRE